MLVANCRPSLVTRTQAIIRFKCSRCLVRVQTGDSDTRQQYRGRRKQNNLAEERKEHFGMTKADFEWIQHSKTLILDEIAARRGHNINVRSLFSKII